MSGSIDVINQNQLSNETCQSFKEWSVLHHLRKVGITKIKGFSASVIFVFFIFVNFQSSTLQLFLKF